MSADPDSAGALATIRRLVDESLSPSAARAYLEAPVSDAEREEIVSLVRWFRRRYPTGADRLAYVRRASRRWRRHEGPP